MFMLNTIPDITETATISENPNALSDVICHVKNGWTKKYPEIIDSGKKSTTAISVASATQLNFEKTRLCDNLTYKLQSVLKNCEELQ